MIIMIENKATGNPAGQKPEFDITDDMRDGEDIQKWPDKLGQAISYIHTKLFETYFKYDMLSRQKQMYHKIFACFAVVCGSAAIILAVLQVFFRSIPLEVGAESVKIFELISFSIAVIAIGVAFASRFHKEWLKKRFLAEKCRSLKFRALIHPFLWCVSEGPWDKRYEIWKKHFNKKVSSVKMVDAQSLETCTTSDEIDQLSYDTNGCIFDVPALSSLTQYYTSKRLSEQIAYFRTRARHFESINLSTGWILNVCFVAGIVCAAIHFGIDLFFLPRNPELHSVSLLFLLLTILFPVFAIGARTLRSSVEVSRSAAFFQAKAHALENFKTKLDEELAKESKQWAQILKLMWQCENFFECENREWLRMMSAAEYFL
jgi:hypothetical protein